jgi:hypothetical protein
MLSAPWTARTPAPDNGDTHKERSCLRSMMKYRLAGSDQPLDGSKLIGKAALNVLEPGGGREIVAVAEKRLYVGHEQVGLIEEIVCLRQLRGGGCIQRLCDDHTVTFDASEEAAR